MINEFYDELRSSLESGRRFVLCTVIEADGSSPGKPGNLMIVFEDGTTCGTIGGGVNEEKVRLESVEILSTTLQTRVVTFNLSNPVNGPEPICGGAMKVFLQVMQKRPALAIFGAGHIGNALAKIAHLSNFRVSIVDERPEYLSRERLLDGIETICCKYEESFSKIHIDSETAIVIVTPGHKNDLSVLKESLKTASSYIGMIGSARKVAENKKVLIEDGVDPLRIDSIFAPIGIYLGGNSPQEIAVSILAQIIAFRNGLSARFDKSFFSSATNSVKM
ncbi:MAG: XdhC family protein [Candidatus Riflebacteria bacterium]|nr:XdhC family protein [Candidatus Riflebacteria bacterium]